MSRRLAAVAVLAGLLQIPAPATAGPTADPPPPPPLTAVPADPGTHRHPYVFTQVHHDNLWWWNGTWRPQSVPDGARVQIQLPGGPAQWKPHTGPDCHPTGTADRLPHRAHSTLTGHGRLPNEGRIAGFSDLQTFDYTVSGHGPVALCLRAEPDLARPEDIGLPSTHPVTYVLTLLVDTPQSSLPSPP
ncbi:hypothetical protein SSP35_11_00960 [Streptomyces sp. NBRC 110611]|uniref:hypothetical protein n=1 Tax=Streptomyces sp. NBRC 110611 TaxID=1621259 RepID=UPI000831711D|nr:hypothetical protein [Streptomyces sp. NBRC 110611]GAU69277.1 hypothetical protein SSP35_11_00960 [Streptomyces sp. NBRC 110611]